MYIWFFHELLYTRFSLVIFIPLRLWGAAWNSSQIQQQIIIVKHLLEDLRFCCLPILSSKQYLSAACFRLSYFFGIKNFMWWKKSTKEIELSKSFPNHWITSESKERICLNKNWSNIPEIIRLILDKSKLTMSLERKAKYLPNLHSFLALQLLLAYNFSLLVSKDIAFVFILIA